MTMHIRHLLSLDDRRVNVGEWDWEAHEAHKRGMIALDAKGTSEFVKRLRLGCFQGSHHKFLFGIQ